MKTKPPSTRRSFPNAGQEINYLYDKVLFWYYRRGDRRRALRFVNRFETLLRQEFADHGAILGEECWALVRELRNDLRGAIAHRKRQIELIRRLHAISLNTPTRAIVLQTYGYDELSDRLDLLAILYFKSGDLDAAIETLQESRMLCRAHGIRFDGQYILSEYLADKARRNGHQANGRTRLRARKLA